jgi:hypothetical protein
MERLSESERRELWDRWEDGASQRSIARALGRAPATVRTRLLSSGWKRPVPPFDSCLWQDGGGSSSPWGLREHLGCSFGVAVQLLVGFAVVWLRYHRESVEHAVERGFRTPSEECSLLPPCLTFGFRT